MADRCIHEIPVHEPATVRMLSSGRTTVNEGRLIKRVCTKRLNSEIAPCECIYKPDCRVDCSQYAPFVEYNEDRLRDLIIRIVEQCVWQCQWDRALWWCEAYGMDVYAAADLLDQRSRVW